MVKLGVHRILLLVISLTKCPEGAKLLADFKKCGDLECETLICRVLAIRDYRGPDCRYLNFTKGEEISVYVKLAGEKDLWAGSKEKDFGYFPRDAVQIEEVFISEEIQIPTKESDFLCLLGVSYTFENEDSELKSDNGENIYPYEEDKDQKSSIYENDFLTEPGSFSTSESIGFEDQFPVSESPEDIRRNSESSNWEGIEAGNVKQDPIPGVDYVPPPSTVPEVKGWFGFGKEQAEEKTVESIIEPLQKSSFQSRKIAEDENDLEELNNIESQTEHKKEPESEFNSVPKKQSEVSESEHILSPQATGWFGSGFTSYLGFGGDDTGLELLPKESNTPLQNVPNSVSSEEESTVPRTEILTEKEDTITNASSVLKPSWFDFGFNMLGFAYANEDKIITDDGKNEKEGEGDKHEYPSTSEFHPNKEQEIKSIKIMETENQLDTVSKIGLPMRIHEEVQFKTPSSKNNDEKSKTSLDTEGSAQEEIDRSVENTLPNNQMFSTKYSLSSQNYIAQKEDASECPILKYLFQIDVSDFMNAIFSPIVILTERAERSAQPARLRRGGRRRRLNAAAIALGAVRSTPQHSTAAEFPSLIPKSLDFQRWVGSPGRASGPLRESAQDTSTNVARRRWGNLRRPRLPAQLPRPGRNQTQGWGGEEMTSRGLVRDGLRSSNLPDLKRNVGGQGFPGGGGNLDA
ncbi:Melanoma inhibitory activity protein 2 [Pteropus alecto]|uniref:Melanoma inhibitory activity protein 2 n=1 Tax=Pteropus alecto TaxID=9402 RepID=L5KIZ4_PTEAL|nr:Melanoma inhibitory activity protein 2 [Pteropus alecto]